LLGALLHDFDFRRGLLNAAYGDEFEHFHKRFFFRLRISRAGFPGKAPYPNWEDIFIGDEQSKSILFS